MKNKKKKDEAIGNSNEIFEIAHRMKEKRVQLGKTLQEVSEESGIAKSTISNWENGKHVPNLHTVIEVCKVYGLNIINTWR